MEMNYVAHLLLHVHLTLLSLYRKYRGTLD